MPTRHDTHTSHEVSSSQDRICAADCTRPVPPHRRKYCDEHGLQASKLRKREVRRAQTRAYTASGGTATPPYLIGWPSRDAYNARCREAMRRSRARRRATNSHCAA